MKYHKFKLYRGNTRKFTELNSLNWTIRKNFEPSGWLEYTELELSVRRKSLENLRKLKIDFGDSVVFKRRRYYIKQVDECSCGDDNFYSSIVCIRYPSLTL